MVATTQPPTWEFERLEALYALSRKILRAESLKSVAGEALAAVARMMAPWRASVGFIDEQREHFTVYVAQGSGRAAWEPGVSVPLHDFGADLEKLSRGQVDVEDDVRASASKHRSSKLASSALLSQMITPIIFGGELVGTLNVGSDRQAAFGEQEISVAVEVAELITMAFGQVSRRDEILDAREQAESRSRLKSDYLANMTHEIRTPLNAIIGASGLLQNRDLPEEARRLVDIIHQGGEQLLEVVSNILDLSKLEAGSFVLERRSFSLRRVVRRTTSLVETTARDKGLALRLTLDPDLPDDWMGDDTRLSQVLANLLSNAVKFTAEGHVHLEARPWTNEAQQPIGVRFCVEDTGGGIPPDRVDAIFEPFAQAESSTSREYGGTGLGLSICRKIVRMMGGELTLDSVVGRGSRFLFGVRLHVDSSDAPRRRTASEGSWAHPSGGAPIKSTRVLIAEDNPVNQRILEQLLRRLGYSADVVDSGADAVEAVRTGGYDLVLMDVQMPEIDGLEASRRVRALRLERPPRIVALTASATTEQREACLDAGMDDFITKPIRATQLERVLSDAAKG